MKLINQVCTLEQAIKFKELGVAQQSVFVHLVDPKDQRFPHVGLTSYYLDDRRDIYAAFTTAELGVMLPNEVEDSYDNYFFHKRGMVHRYISVQNRVLKEWQGTAVEAHRRAEMLIWLIENKFTTVEHVNARLKYN